MPARPTLMMSSARYEFGIHFDAPEGRVLLDPATHHLTMTIRLAQVQADHSIKFVEDFGPIEPWWLRSSGRKSRAI